MYQPRSDKTSNKPTPTELEILRLLWSMDRSTVREVHAKLHPDGSGSYTGTLKLMQIMHQKGLLIRDEKERAHVYTPAIAKSEAQQQLVGDIMSRFFDGSGIQLALQALGSSKPLSTDEIEALRAMLDKIEKEHGR